MPQPPVEPAGTPSAVLVPPSLTHRLEGRAVIGVVVAVLLLVAAAGAAVALMVPGGRDPSPVPTFPHTGTTTPSATAALQLIETEYLSVEVPADWTVVTRERNSIVVSDPGGSHLSLLTYPASGLPTPDAYVEGIMSDAKRRYPDATVCEAPQAAPVPGGPRDGLGFALCYTLIAEGGQAVSIKSLYFLGFQGLPGAAPGNAPFYSYAVFAERSSLDDFISVLIELPLPSWKLYVTP